MTQATSIEGPIACTRETLPQVITLVDGAMRKGSDQTFLTDYPLVYREENWENIRIIKAGGIVASVVPFLPWEVSIDGCRFTAGIISPTATHPEHQHHGYARQCLHSCIARMEALEIDVSVLWTLIPTFRFYEHGDYQAVRDQHRLYAIGKADAALFSKGSEEVVAYDPASGRYLADIRTLHEQDSFGMVRSETAYQSLLTLPKMHTLLAVRDGVPRAYLLVSRAPNKPGLIEGGGEEAALETLMHHALDALGDDERITAYSYLASSALGDMLARKLPEHRPPAAAGMMVRINRPRALCEKIAPWLAAKSTGREIAFSLGITDTGEVISFRFSHDALTLGEETLTLHVPLSRRELASVIFGAHPERPYAIPDIMAEIFPCYFPIFILDRS